jgi:hypothetical protein
MEFWGCYFVQAHSIFFFFRGFQGHLTTVWSRLHPALNIPWRFAGERELFPRTKMDGVFHPSIDMSMKNLKMGDH